MGPLLIQIECIVILLLVCLYTSQAGDSQKLNVLFLAVDDLRPEINSYIGPDFPGPIHPRIHTPNMDSLFSRSLVLKRAYVQQAICSPSRTSLLTGRRPDTTHVYDLETYFRKVGGNFTTIPQYFKENGYLSIGMGKIFHRGLKASGKDDPPSWSVPYFHASRYWQSRNHSWLAVDNETLAQHPHTDAVIAQRAVKTLKQLAKNSTKADHKPFFLAVGFHKPHLPFIFPKKYLDLYPKDNVRLPDNPYAPTDMPEIAWSDYGELLHYDDISKLNMSGDINTTLPEQVVKDLRRAYYCAVSHTDEMIGLVLDELKSSGFGNNTIISFWGDHGYQLGEHGEWTKHTNFDLATHAPMMLHIPNVTEKGIITEELTEFVDLFPTLVEAAGLPPLKRCPRNSTNVKVCTEGDSMMPLISKPVNTNWKKRVFSQYPRDRLRYANQPMRGPEPNGKFTTENVTSQEKQDNEKAYEQIGQDELLSNKPAPNHPYHIMGYSMRTPKYRYTEWVGFEPNPVYKPKWHKVYGIELYDLDNDPEENHNVFEEPSYKIIVQGLSKMLHRGWRKADE